MARIKAGFKAMGDDTPDARQFLDSMGKIVKTWMWHSLFFVGSLSMQVPKSKHKKDGTHPTRPSTQNYGTEPCRRMIDMIRVNDMMEPEP